MSMTKRFWALALGAALTVTFSRAHAQDIAWRPAAPSSAPATRTAAPSGPMASLGRPIAVTDPDAPYLPPLPAEGTAPAAFAEPIAGSWPAPVIVLAQAGDPVPPPVPPPGTPPAPTYPLDPNVDINTPVSPASGGHFWDHMGSWAGKGCKFQSDHGFDNMISPLGNPFFFEDPRSLTEVRPIFFYQKTPQSNLGGHSEFYGLQARVALTEKWSIVMNKLGFVSLHPNDPIDDLQSSTGFAEVDIGPKWTFYRCESSGTVLATGLTFEIPTGSKADQNTGTLGLDPYITYAQNFGFAGQNFRSLNFMAEAGYSFATDDKRAEYFHASMHLDYDLFHRLYPLVEVNWFHTTKRGDARDLSFEGTDLVNFGSRQLTDKDMVTMDLGARYKVREWLQFGAAVELPLTSRKDLENYRLLFDVIIRY